MIINIINSHEKGFISKINFSSYKMENINNNNLNSYVNVENKRQQEQSNNLESDYPVIIDSQNNTSKVLEITTENQNDKQTQNSKEVKEEYKFYKSKAFIISMTIITIIVVASIIVFPVLFAKRSAKIVKTFELDNEDIEYRLSQLKINDFDENGKSEEIGVVIHTYNLKPNALRYLQENDIPEITSENCVSHFNSGLASTFTSCINEVTGEEKMDVSIPDDIVLAEAMQNKIRMLIESKDPDFLEDHENLHDAIRYLQDSIDGLNPISNLNSTSLEDIELKIFDDLDDDNSTKSNSTEVEKDPIAIFKKEEAIEISKKLLKTNFNEVILPYPQEQNNTNYNSEIQKRILFGKRFRRAFRKIGRSIFKGFKKVGKALAKVTNKLIKESIVAVKKAGPYIGAVAGGAAGFFTCGPPCMGAGIKLGYKIGAAAQTALKACPPSFNDSNQISGIKCDKSMLVKGAIMTAGGYAASPYINPIVDNKIAVVLGPQIPKPWSF